MARLISLPKLGIAAAVARSLYEHSPQSKYFFSIRNWLYNHGWMDVDIVRCLDIGHGEYAWTQVVALQKITSKALDDYLDSASER